MLLYLISLVEDKDVPKIEYIYNKYHADMLRFAKCRLKKAKIPSYVTDAEDVVQNAFCKICKYISKIDVNVHERVLKTYVLTIVANESNNFISNYEFVEPFDDGYAEMGDDDFIRKINIAESYERVIKAIESMDEKYSITLLYRYHKGMSVKQIADFMGISEKTVYTRLLRGRKLLLEMLEGNIDV
jgi:RNA polymerase sigma-70 factor (ECF subfamily)